jgi:hypothetical protein
MVHMWCFLSDGLPLRFYVVSLVPCFSLPLVIPISLIMYYICVVCLRLSSFVCVPSTDGGLLLLEFWLLEGGKHTGWF